MKAHSPVFSILISLGSPCGYGGPDTSPVWRVSVQSSLCIRTLRQEHRLNGPQDHA